MRGGPPKLNNEAKAFLQNAGSLEGTVVQYGSGQESSLPGPLPPLIHGNFLSNHILEEVAHS